MRRRLCKVKVCVALPVHRSGAQAVGGKDRREGQNDMILETILALSVLYAAARFVVTKGIGAILIFLTTLVVWCLLQ